MIVPYVLLFLGGLGFGFAAPGVWRWLPIVFPLVLFLMAAFSEGVDGTMVVRLVVALLITAVGVLLGVVLRRRDERGRQARYA